MAELKEQASQPKPVKRYTLREAMTRYLLDNEDMPSIKHSASIFRSWEPLTGDLILEHVCDETLAEAKATLKARGLSNRTVNIGVQRIGRLLNLAARKWREDDGKRPWMMTAPPMLTMLKEDSGVGYPLSRDEERMILDELDPLRASIAVYLVNSGSREQEALKLRWDWEVPVPELGTSVFVIPPDFGGRTGDGGVKNGELRVVVMNSAARSVIESRRGIDRDWVFADEEKPLYQLNGTIWRRARRNAAAKYKEQFGKASPGLESARVHDLKHTFGSRLRAAGVTLQDMQDLLGHKRRTQTDHYSVAEIGRLIEAAEKVLDVKRSSPTLTMIKRKVS